MPRIDKQTPPPNSRKTTSTAAKEVKVSLLDQAIDVRELVTSWLKFVIYGQNRVGKTTLACQFPKPLLLVGLEPNLTGGALSVTKVEGVKYICLRSSKHALQLADELKQGGVCNLPDSRWNGRPYTTVVIDSATSYQDIILMEILGLTAVPEMLSWGMVDRDQYRARSEKTREALRPFLALPCHTIVTAKERDHNADKEKPTIIRGQRYESFFAADLGGQTVGWLQDACDYIGQLYITKEIKTEIVRSTYGTGDKMQVKERVEETETGKLVRRLRTMYHPNFAAGFRSPTPEKVPEYIENPTFDKIYRVIKGE